MSRFILNCSNFTEHQFWQLGLARGVSGIACLLLCTLILVFILVHRAYKSVLQRLFLYQTAAAFLYLLATSLQIEHVFEYRGQQDFCKLVGFLVQCSGSTVALLSFEVTVFLFFKVLFLMQGEVAPVIRSKRVSVVLETVAVVVAIFLPLSIDWVVWVRGNYGINGGWCWIKTIHHDCSTAGLWDQIILYYVPLAVLVAVIIFTVLVMMFIFCVSAWSYRTTRHIHQKRVEETAILLLFIVVFATLSGLEATDQLYTGFSHKHKNYALWMVYAIGCPFGKLVLPVGFLVYLYSLRRFTWASVKAAVTDWREECKGCCWRRAKEEREVEDARCNPVSVMTFPSSHPQVLPSATTIPYTGAFTSVTEREPLIGTRHDTGYCSFYTATDAASNV